MIKREKTEYVAPRTTVVDFKFQNRILIGSRDDYDLFEW